jgi:mannose-6-phosphate isomerase-like protein (cupin superfamily)
MVLLDAPAALRDHPAMDTPQSLPVDETAAALPEFWSQQVLGEANGSLFKVAKGVGSTEWHAHDDQDEVFLVTHGELVVELRSGDVTVGPGELFIVPRTVEHRPRAAQETRFLIVGATVTSNAAGGKPAWSTDGGVPDAG